MTSGKIFIVLTVAVGDDESCGKTDFVILFANKC
jgi:hypothetical protein